MDRKVWMMECEYRGVRTSPSMGMYSFKAVLPNSNLVAKSLQSGHLILGCKAERRVHLTVFHLCTAELPRTMGNT